MVESGVEEGTPVAVNNVPLGPVELLESLNALAGEHGVGRADVVEDRLVGMKSRGVYETPGGTLLHAAHRELEQLVLDRRTLRLKEDRKSTRLNSSHGYISYAVFCLKKKKKTTEHDE